MLHLDGSTVALQANDLSYEIILSHSDKLVHGCSTHIVCHHHRPRYLSDISAGGQVSEDSDTARPEWRNKDDCIEMIFRSNVYARCLV